MDWKFGKKIIGNKEFYCINDRPINIPGRRSQYDFINEFMPKIKVIFLMKQPISQPDKCLYGINEQGDIVWDFNKDNYLNLSMRFKWARIDPDGTLEIFSLNGQLFKIDHLTGKVIETLYEKIDYHLAGSCTTKNGIEGEILAIKSKKHCLSGGMLDACALNGVLAVVVTKPTNVWAFDSWGNKIWDFREVNKGTKSFPEELDKKFSTGDIFVMLHEKTDRYYMDVQGCARYEIDYRTGRIITDYYHR